MQRRLRLGLIVVGVLLGLLLVAGFIARSLLSPERFTNILQRAASDAGLVLELQSPAEPALFPRPSVNMRAIRLHMPGEPTLLSARQVRLVVPWSSLLGGAPAITRLEINSPRVDLVQVRSWLGQLPTSERDGPPKLPDIGAGVRIRHGRLVSGSHLLLDQISLDTGTLEMGQRFTLDIEAMSADGQPVALHLSTVPAQRENLLQLDALTVQLGSGESTTLNLAGELAWRGGNRLRGTLAGELVHTATSYAISASFAPQAVAKTLLLDLRLDSDSTHVALAMSPRKVWQWWQVIRSDAGSQLPLPPVQGTVTSEQLDIGSLHIEGLSIESTLPTPASSVAPTPASSAAPVPARSTGIAPAASVPASAEAS